MTESTYTVGQLAKATDTKAVTIRYYEQQGLLPLAARTPAGYRLYTETERDRLLFIRRSRGLGFSLDDVRELLGLADRKEHSCAAVDAKVELQLAQVRDRIRDLQGLESELTRLIACCQGGVIEECRIIESLSNRNAVRAASTDKVSQ
ncbi:helix-turn-helix domain-containing protein [Pseudomonas sp. JQ170]|uniref:MerR family transcriptional regulator n=1 Tax=unclassified Pseudomonas TaxID=196821 RepID=UPI002653E25D|nr:MULTISPECIES: helix-turn-helix domain-containing protein [unclassified Pseudomonas]MDN7143956.1 helix-turn-helix domain-containing protein [Pseudomonas sp. JQ170]WRO78382.1 helix-turn-helix domain-containing protein [Pseudomonas sp. 170C]